MSEVKLLLISFYTFICFITPTSTQLAQMMNNYKRTNNMPSPNSKYIN